MLIAFNRANHDEFYKINLQKINILLIKIFY